MELAVNMPEQEPQVGQAELSIVGGLASLTFASAADDHGIDQVDGAPLPSSSTFLPPSGRPRRRSSGC